MTVLLVTNDFPPTVGGIQSYLRDFANELAPEQLVVFASTQDVQAARDYDQSLPYTVVRWPRRIMLPTPSTVRRMRELIHRYDVDTVWFGAAAPLAIMAGAAKLAGARRVVATTHGHEVGWSMVPGARQILRIIGNNADVVTYISEYTLRRFRRAFGTHPAFYRLPSGVDTNYFRPATASEKQVTRSKHGLTGRTLIVCASRLVPRKGQDQLIRAMHQVSESHPEAMLVIVGQGSYRDTLEVLARPLPDQVRFTGALPRDDMRDLVAAADIVAMPARTRGAGLDVEGLGIVYLEAQACGIPVIAGRSGGAPETVTPDTGIVVDGSDVTAVARALGDLLGDPDRREAMGAAGRAHVTREWTWGTMGQRLRHLLQQEPESPDTPGEDTLNPYA